jgi:hypothetical protein
MRLERFAVMMAVMLGLVAVVLSMLIATSDPAHAQADPPTPRELPGGGENPILSATAPRAPEKPATLSAGSDDLGVLQKAPLPSGRHLPQLETIPDSPEAFSNGDFESEPPPGSWLEASANGFPLVLHTTVTREGFILPDYMIPRSGNRAAWLGGAYDEISFIRQSVEIPASRVTIGFWMWIESADYCGYDFGGVIFHDDTVADVFPLCDDWNTYGWVKREVQYTTCSPRTFAFQIRAETDSSLNSNLFIDDVTFDVEPIECTSLYLPLVVKDTGGPPPDPYAAPCDGGNNYCEPHNSCLTAHGPLKPGRAYSAYPEDTNDYYYLELSDPATVSVQVTNYRADGQLVLRDPNDLQNPLAFDFETPTGDGTMSVSKTNVGEGRYCVQVYTADGHFQSSTRYTLILSD